MNDHFAYEDREVRTMIKDGEPWWVTKDVANVFEYQTNPARLFANVPENGRGCIRYTPLKGRYLIPTLGGMEESQSDCYPWAEWIRRNYP
jgi:hypothetical protein